MLHLPRAVDSCAAVTSGGGSVLAAMARPVRRSGRSQGDARAPIILLPLPTSNAPRAE